MYKKFDSLDAMNLWIRAQKENKFSPYEVVGYNDITFTVLCIRID